MKTLKSTVALEVAVRELKARLSMYLRKVQAGATVIVTDRGKAIGKILPMTDPVKNRARELVSAGLRSWNGERFTPPAKLPATQGRKTVAELLLEGRR